MRGGAGLMHTMITHLDYIENMLTLYKFHKMGMETWLRWCAS